MDTELVSNVAITSNNSKNIEQKLPGDLAMWIFIAMELSVFAIFFIAFAVAQRLNIDMFSVGRSSLDASVGLYCTLALIISSYFVALSVTAIKKGNNYRAKWLLLVSMFSASGYLLFKLREYSSLLDRGFELSTNTFYTLYFFITGFHFMHVLLGMIILAYMAFRANKNEYNANNSSGFEAGASYWHMVDLVWIIVFFLIYIIH
jgi:nitric oxide reductase NorE protein